MARKRTAKKKSAKPHHMVGKKNALKPDHLKKRHKIFSIRTSEEFHAEVKAAIPKYGPFILNALKTEVERLKAGKSEPSPPVVTEAVKTDSSAAFRAELKRATAKPILDGKGEPNGRFHFEHPDFSALREAGRGSEILRRISKSWFNEEKRFSIPLDLALEIRDFVNAVSSRTNPKI